MTALPKVRFYMACFYNLNRRERQSALVDRTQRDAAPEEQFSEGDPPRMCEVIRRTNKNCLAFKILAASRNCATQADVARAFRFAFDNIKPKDAVVVGMFPRFTDQIAENVRHVLSAVKPRGFLEKTGEEI